MAPTNHQWRKLKNLLVQSVTCACALLVIAPLALVFFHLARSGVGSVILDFFTHLPKRAGAVGGGMANAIVGTFVLLGVAALFGVPVGALGGACWSEYGSSALS